MRTLCDRHQTESERKSKSKNRAEQGKFVRIRNYREPERGARDSERPGRGMAACASAAATTESRPSTLSGEFGETIESLRPFDQSVKVNLWGTVTICDDERATDVADLIPSWKKCSKQGRGDFFPEGQN
jgi:hypothetical protein